jgi:hypothetical protein
MALNTTITGPKARSIARALASTIAVANARGVARVMIRAMA